MELQELRSYIQEHQPNICQISYPIWTMFLTVP